MTDAERPPTERDGKTSIAQEDNAVGYREYVEGLDLEVSDREVGLCPEGPFCEMLMLAVVPKGSLED